MKHKIVTVTFNPALDLTCELEEFNQGKVNSIASSMLEPAGKGINVAKVLSDLGAKVIVTGFLGRENEDSYRAMFTQKGIEDQFVRVAGATRTNIKLVENDRTVTDMNFPSFEVSVQDVIALENRIFEVVRDVEYVVFSGSLAKGLSPKVASLWITKLKQQGKKVLLDSSNEMLRLSIEQQPWMIKPNEYELAELMSTPHLADHSQNIIDCCFKAADLLNTQGIVNVLVSLGEKGIIWITDEAKLYGKISDVEVVSTVGAGDSVVAAFCWASLNNYTTINTLKFSIAMGANAVSQVGVGVQSIKDVEKLQHRVEVTFKTELST